MVKQKNSKLEYSSKFQRDYHNIYREELKKELELSSIMEVPILKKIVVSSGIGEAVNNPKIIDNVMQDIALITGQAAVKRNARKSIAGFKIREGMVIGVMVTLRRRRMYEFLERLVHIDLPRVRDFNGVSLKSFDQQGNYTIGIKEQITFPEINFDKVDSVRGLNITLVIQSKKTEHSIKLLQKFQFPLKKK